MNIAILGAGGWMGGHLVREALARQHRVTAVVRDSARFHISDKQLRVAQADVQQPTALAEALRGHDAVISAISGRRDQDPANITKAAGNVLAAMILAGVKRLAWVGGAGSLEIATGVRLVDSPDFPSEWKSEALAQGAALKIFRDSTADLDWTYVSPAAIIFPGTRGHAYRIGGDQLLVDDEGQSRISVEDYAVAVLDVLEQYSHRRSRIGVAY